MARPRATRCRWPPESSFGLRFEQLSDAESISATSFTRRSISACGDAAQLQAEGHVVVDAHVRVERVVLEDHRDVAVLRRDVVDDAARR